MDTAERLCYLSGKLSMSCSYSYASHLGTMVRTTIVLPDEEFQELKEIAAAQDRSISWLLREAFRLSKNRLRQSEAFGVSFDRIWREIGETLRQRGIKSADIPSLIRAERGTRAHPRPKGRAR